MGISDSEADSRRLNTKLRLSLKSTYQPYIAAASNSPADGAESGMPASPSVVEDISKFLFL